MTFQTAQPTLVLMAGLPGTGKTTLAFRLGAALQWPVLDKDTMKAALMLVPIQEQLSGFTAYELLFAIAHDIYVKQRLSIILDSPAVHPFILERADELVHETDGCLKVLYCTVDSAIRNYRLGNRKASLGQLQNDTLYTDDNPQLFSHLPATSLLLNTGNSLEECMATAIVYLMQ